MPLMHMRELFIQISTNPLSSNHSGFDESKYDLRNQHFSTDFHPRWQPQPHFHYYLGFDSISLLAKRRAKIADKEIDSFKQVLENILARDLDSRTTMVGHHWDNFEFYASNYSSLRVRMDS